MTTLRCYIAADLFTIGGFGFRTSAANLDLLGTGPGPVPVCIANSAPVTSAV